MAASKNAAAALLQMMTGERQIAFFKPRIGLDQFQSTCPALNKSREEHVAPTQYTLTLTETAKGLADHPRHLLLRHKAVERAYELGITG
jgi:hypothetical protein